MKDIYKTIDSRLTKNKEALIAFAQSQEPPFSTYAEYIHTTLKTKTAVYIRGELLKVIRNPPVTMTIWGVNLRINDLVGAKKVKKGGRICVAEGCKRKVPPENHRFCHKCYLANMLKSTYFDEGHRNMYA